LTIERSTDNIAFIEIASVGASATSYASTGLVPATTYYYRVRAYNAGGNSGYSNTASATSQAAAPAPPTALKAQSNNHNIKLSWTWSVSPNITQTKVYRSTVNGGPYALVATLSGTATSYVDTGLTIRTTYYYVVTAVNSSGAESVYSNQAFKKAQ
jgi:fibronectin type 3 domain-containing protein